MKKYSLLLILFITISCQVSERPIVYGTDDCAYCKMIIMDQRYGSELVTDKGKILTFDAAECLIEYALHNKEVADKAYALLVTPYTDPNSLINAKTASYLVSEQMPSPMGAYLTSFSNQQTAESFLSDKGGTLYTWDELMKDLRAIRLKAIEEFE